MAKREIINMLKAYVALLNAEGISIQKAFLYGSHSVGNAVDSSDIDVMLISDKYDETDDVVIGKTWQLTRQISTKIEPFFIGMKKFKNDDSSPLINIVKSKGIEIT